MNILLTSVGRRSYLVNFFKEALVDKGVVHAANSIDTHTLHVADQFVITPEIYNDSYIDFLINYCNRFDISVIISLFDIDLYILSVNKEKFKNAGINIIVSNSEVIKICNDKWLTYRFLKDIQVNQPQTFISLSDVKNAISSNILSYPVYLKPRWGMGSIGIYKAYNELELDVLYKKIHNEIFNTYLKYESISDVASCIIIQEAICGKEYGLEILNDLSGNFTACFAKQKLAMRAGETDMAITVSTLPFSDLAHKISKELKHIGNLDIDLFIKEDGSIYVLELNCRFGGQYPFSHMAGVNIPLQLIEWLEGKPNNPALVTQRIGVKCCKELVPVVF